MIVGQALPPKRSEVVSDFGSQCVIPKGTARDARISRSGTKGGYEHAGEWIAACKGGPETSCNFDYAGRMIEMMLLGHVAYRAGKPLEYDPETGKVTNHEPANEFLRRQYRNGWPLVG